MVDEQKITWFHGHFKPYVVVGWRMGECALRLLGAKRHELAITSAMGTETPTTCVLDGLQLSTGSTIGNGLLKVLGGREMWASFTYKGKRLDMKVKDFKYDLDHVLKAEDEALFDWSWSHA